MSMARHRKYENSLLLFFSRSSSTLRLLFFLSYLWQQLLRILKSIFHYLNSWYKSNIMHLLAFLFEILWQTKLATKFNAFASTHIYERERASKWMKEREYPTANRHFCSVVSIHSFFRILLAVRALDVEA